MKPTKKIEKEVLEVYDSWLHSYLNGDVKTYSFYLDDEYHFIGSTSNEEFLNRKDTAAFFKKTSDQLSGKTDLKNRIRTIESFDGLVFITELFDAWFHMGAEWKYYGRFRFTSALQNKKEGWRFIYQHFSMPDSKAQEGETLGAEQVSKENLELRDAIKRRTLELEEKNRELEIETALEKVRAVAMSMKEPADMLAVCESISQQLQSLGVKEIRNVQTAIFYENRGTYMNYEYYAKHRKKIITETNYTNHKIQNAFALKMLKGKGEIYTTHLNEKKVKEWLAYQKTTNVFIDRFLEKASSLNYYWDSLGPVALGISTYVPLQEKDLGLVRQFRNVFELAYTRYLDIEQAIAQAREAQIEASLERVRSRSMAMHKSSELQAVINTVHKEFTHLNIASNGGSFIALNNDIKTELRFWGSGGTADTTEEVHLPRYKKRFCTNLLNNIKSGPGFFTEEYSPKEKKEFFSFLFLHEPWSKLSAKKKKETLSSPGGYTRSCCVLQHTSIFIVNHFGEKFSDADNDILQRFAKVFEQTYTRFLDLQKAEAQARDAEIELALERVRSRTMAMQHSDELQDTALLLTQQVKTLGMPSFGCGFNIWDADRKAATAWMAGEDRLQSPFKTSSSEDIFFRIHEAAKKGQQLFVVEQGGKELKTHYKYMASIPAFKDVMDKMAKAGLTVPGFQIMHCAFFSQGYLMFISYEPVPEAHDIFIRFAKVFEQTYTRFLDLQKAEVQTREAKIEAAVERVRAEAMAMHSTSDFEIVVKQLLQQIKHLSLEGFTGAQIILIDEKEFLTVWDCSSPGNIGDPKSETIRYEAKRFPIMGVGILNKWKEGKPYFVMDFDLKTLRAAVKEWKKINVTIAGIINDAISGGHLTHQWDACGRLHNGMIAFDMIKPPDDDVRNITIKMTQAFEQAYTRFLDLQKAEAQAREAQIELALERVRARTMAMQHSEELLEVATVLFQQVKGLGVPQWNCGFNIWEQGDEAFTYYPGTPEGVISPSPCKIPLHEHPVFRRFDESRKNGIELLVYEKKGREQKDHYRYMLSLPGVGDLLQSMLEAGFELPDFQIDHVANFAYGNLIFITYEHFPEMHQVFKRFAKVFEQTYTRFLDLQKAEAQAREAQIEVSLERVRSRAMAMHKPDELLAAAELVYKELSNLGITSMAVSYAFVNADEKNALYYGINPVDGKIPPVPFVFPHTETEVMRSVLKSWKKQEAFKIIELDDEATLKHQTWVGNHIQTTLAKNDITFSVEEFLSVSPQTAVIYTFHFAQGYIFIIGEERLSAKQEEMVLRFTKVFEMTYQRFLDLQKAEAQTREATIETALEKVRSRSLAMHKTDELQEVVTVVLEKMTELNIELDTININIYKKGVKEANLWTAAPGQKYAVPFHLPFFDHPFHTDVFTTKENGLDFFTKTYSFEEKNTYFNYTFEHSDFKYVPEEKKKLILDGRACTRSIAITKNAGIIMSRYSEKPFSENDNEILKRFAKVFEQAYTRFLDLQKAEGQAREATIEMALERVRSRSLAMHKSNELQEVIETVFDQILQLGIVADVANFIIFNQENRNINCWIASPTQKISRSWFVPYADIYPGNALLIEKERGNDSFATSCSFEQKNNYFNWAFEHSDFKYIPEDRKEFVLKSKCWTISYAWVKHTGIQLSSYSRESFTENENEILKRFARVFEQSYIRFLDLQKAEASAREAQIEAAVEKVRSRSLAMHTSNELNEVVSILFEKIKELQIPATAVGIATNIEGTKDLNAYVCGENENGLVITNYRLPYFKNQISKDLYNVLDKQLDVFVGHYSKKEKDTFYKYLLEHTDEFKDLPHDILQMIFESKTYTMTMVAVKNAVFNINDFEGKVLAEKDVDIIKRFAKVFDQAYTRFLDLQKAEKQARENQIQLALERARAQSMVMQHSNELDDTLRVFHEQVLLLGIHSAFSFLWLPDEEKSNHIFWAAWEEDLPAGEAGKNDSTVFKSKAITYPLDREEPATAQCLIDWRSDEPVHSYAVKPSEVDNYFAAWDELLDGVEKLKPELFRDGLYYVEAFMKYGCFGVMLQHDLSGEEKNILYRFSIEFERTYTRFLDLQKAEAQAREAKIEAALERVRSSSMAMHHSEELETVVKILSEKLIELGLSLDGALIYCFEKEERNFHLWIATNQLPVPIKVNTPYIKEIQNNPIVKNLWEAIETGRDFINKTYTGKAKNDYFSFIGTHNQTTIPEPIRKFHLEAETWTVSLAAGKNSVVGIDSWAGRIISQQDFQVLKRFAQVFEQAYTRFLDLQKAEAQTREAKIEMALEKIRSRTMAMQHSDELPEAANLLFLEVQALGIPAWSAGYNILSEDKRSSTCIMSSEGTLQQPFELPLTGESSFLEWYDFLESEEQFFVQEMGGKELQEHYGYMTSLPELKGIFQHIQDSGLSLPTYQINHLAKYTYGFLLFITYKQVPDAHDIFKRFTKVFEQTYTRFLDLQKAEAQAREAQIETGLEKVRSRTLAMQTSEELADTSIVIFEQLINLGIEPNRLFIGIINDKTRSIEAWATNEDGTRIGNHFTLNTDKNKSVKKMYAGWRDKKTSTSIDMQGKDLQEYFHYLSDEMHIPFQGGLSQKRRVQTIAYFGQGLIGMASPEEQPAATTQLLERFAAVFNLTYTRFNDLKIAEAQAIRAEQDLVEITNAKQSAEAALVELQAAQKQLIQSEKMASLGELTAGIAHEIQNPLNFVNNFSEVSKELLGEMREEMGKGNLEGVKEIMNDIIQNLEKINNHGKRADAIVKGMLQHSQSSKGQTQPTDINALCDEYLRLSYHGLRAKDKSFNAELITDFDKNIGKINIIPQDIGRVILNLINNAFYAVDERNRTVSSTNSKGGQAELVKTGLVYKPTVSISTKKFGDKVEIKVTDNGNGISESIKEKIFQPFFTTKPTGKGTGLGLSLSYDIIKAHGGEIKVETKDTEGTNFIIILPITG